MELEGGENNNEISAIQWKVSGIKVSKIVWYQIHVSSLYLLLFGPLPAAKHLTTGNECSSCARFCRILGAVYMDPRLLDSADM